MAPAEASGSAAAAAAAADPAQPQASPASPEATLPRLLDGPSRSEAQVEPSKPRLPPAAAQAPDLEAPADAKVPQPEKSQLCGLRALFVVRRTLKVLGLVVVAGAFLMGLVSWPLDWISSEAATANVVSVLFLVGLVLVILEDHVDVNKAAVMLMVSVAMWTFLAAGYRRRPGGHEEMERVLSKGLEEVGQLILFLLPAMGVVESIDHFGGFTVVKRLILQATGTRTELLMPLICVLVFFLSAVIDNLTATIVALKLLRHVVEDDRHLRHTIGGLVVVAANAGGAWSPVGDVTTTMLWLGSKISVGSTIKWLFLPSFVAGVFPMLGMYMQEMRKRRGDDAPAAPAVELPKVRRANVVILVLGLSAIVMVPVLKMITGLPPYLGMLAALGVLWFVTDTAAFYSLAHLPLPEDLEEPDQWSDIGSSPRQTPRHHGSAPGGVVEALHKMDLTGLLFFAGVLLAVNALNTAGVLTSYAELLVRWCGMTPWAICSLLGLSSAVVDNVPLVQAAIDMFRETPMDDPLWQLTALAGGTGGSILSVGSIAGVTLMTMEGVGYIWFVRRISLWALLGFVGGIATYQLERMLFA